MTLKIIETYDDGDRDFEVWECTDCGWTTITEAGADVCCCPKCEGENQ